MALEGAVAADAQVAQPPPAQASTSVLKEPMTPAQITEAIANADSDLVYLWEQGKGLPVEVQALFSVLGFT